MLISKKRALLAVAVISVFIVGFVVNGLVGGPRPAVASQHGEEFRTISVSGTGEVAVEPNMAQMVLGIQTEGETATEANAANSSAAAAVAAKLKELGIKDEDIKTVSFNLHPVYPPKPDVSRDPSGQLHPVGYRAAHRIEVAVRDIDQVPMVIDESIKAGANTADNISYQIKETDSLREQALARAVAQADAKAKAIAKAAGVQIVEIRSIQEGRVDFGYYRVPMSFDKELMVADEAMPVLPGEVMVRANITMTVRF